MSSQYANYSLAARTNHQAVPITGLQPGRQLSAQKTLLVKGVAYTLGKEDKLLGHMAAAMQRLSTPSATQQQQQQQQPMPVAVMVRQWKPPARLGADQTVREAKVAVTFTTAVSALRALHNSKQLRLPGLASNGRLELMEMQVRLQEGTADDDVEEACKVEGQLQMAGLPLPQ